MTDGDDAEEVAVCYLQCLLADELSGYSQSRAFVDMDIWGYHFRLGSTQRWFEGDSDDALRWLCARDLYPRSVRIGSHALRAPANSENHS